MECINEARLRVWKYQPQKFFREAVIDGDGTIAPTDGECKEGMDLAYNGQWGYHPFTDFSQTKYLDGWDRDGVKFTFGIDASPALKKLAKSLPKFAFQPLVRPPKYEVKTKPRRRPANVKQQIVIEKQFENLRLEREDLAEVRVHAGGVRERLSAGGAAEDDRRRAWAALWLPEEGRWAKQRAAEKQRLLRMEFSTFTQAMIQIPCQIARTARHVVYRLLSWNPSAQVLLRLVSQLRRPLRC